MYKFGESLSSVLYSAQSTVRSTAIHILLYERDLMAMD